MRPEQLAAARQYEEIMASQEAPAVRKDFIDSSTLPYEDQAHDGSGEGFGLQLFQEPVPHVRDGFIDISAVSYDAQAQDGSYEGFGISADVTSDPDYKIGLSIYNASEKARKAEEKKQAEAAKPQNGKVSAEETKAAEVVFTGNIDLGLVDATYEWAR